MENGQRVESKKKECGSQGSPIGNQHPLTWEKMKKKKKRTAWLGKKKGVSRRKKGYLENVPAGIKKSQIWRCGAGGEDAQTGGQCSETRGKDQEGQESGRFPRAGVEKERASPR